MKYLICMILICNCCMAQQTEQFTQFIFNRYGLNPASAGSNLSSQTEIIAGNRRQWIGFDLAPSSSFVGVTHTFKSKKKYKTWQNLGFYLQQEKVGLFNNEGFYMSYTTHVRISHKWNTSFGVFIGARRFSVYRGVISPADPISATTHSSYFFAYPDIIPGFSIYNKRTFFDISVKQLTKKRQVQGSSKIGSGSVLVPQLYITFGRKIIYSDAITLLPAAHLHSSVSNIPSLDLNFMAYFKKRIGIGTSVRNRNFISGILQVKLYKNISVGIAYDYSINKLNIVTPNTLEVMVGMIPISGFDASDKGRTNVAKCPNFDF